VDVAFGSVMIEVTGDPEKIDSIVALLRGFGIKELVRTGVVAMVRGSSAKESASPREVPAWA
jgi:acetolactate synthase-1/3 small subunit